VPATEENLKWLEGKRVRLHQAGEVAEEPYSGTIARVTGDPDHFGNPQERWMHIRRSQGTNLGPVGGVYDRKGKPLPPRWELEPH
jgi:hypothetical protein